MRPFMPHGKCAAVEHDNERIRPISLIRIYDIQNLVFRLIRISQIQFIMSISGSEARNCSLLLNPAIIYLLKSD